MNESKDLKRIQEFVDKLKSTNSTNNKIDIIKEYKEDCIINKVLKCTYSPFKQFHLTSATVKKNKKLEPRGGYHDLFYLLDALSKRTITGHDAIQYTKGYLNDMEEWQKDLVFCILDKNLNNKAIPGSVPTFKVALANSYDKQKGKVDFNKQKWFASQKLDGVRCLAIVDEKGKCNFYSRQGKTFDTLKVLRDEIEGLELTNVVFDGEVCLMDESGVEDFQGIMKEIKRKDHTIQNPKYKVFDYLLLDEFDNQTSTRKLSQRLSTCIKPKLQYLQMLDQWKVESEEHFQELAELATKNSWEGLILRKDSEYKGKRSNDLLKVKKFFDEEYVVKSVETAIHRIIVDGKEVEEEMLGSVIIEHKGCKVGVGSGFDQEERRKYFKNPELIIGKTITVQYFEETTNQDGCHSLRFPVVKHVYSKGRDI